MILEKINFCKNYDVITDFKYDSNDTLTINLKQEYYDSINEAKTESDFRNLIKFDEYLSYYVTESDFYKYIQSDYKNKEFDMEYISDLKKYLIERYELFQDFTVGTIKSGKWF